jgi:predicted flap endonuclease-1-like 5' DNA nuclease
MFLSINFCDIALWQVLLSWLLPFLIGLALGWLLWGKFKAKLKKKKNECDDLKQQIRKLENDLAKCKSANNDHLGTIAILKGQLKEMESSSTKLQKDDDKAVQFGAGVKTSMFGSFTEDNLEVIEGIGPKMNEFLHKNGISNWAALAGKSADFLKTLLEKEGAKYRIIDPSTWPKQAALAETGEWETLIEFQKTLDTGKKKDKHLSNDSKIERLLIKMGILKRWDQDDLKAIEGIGPKIEKLLHHEGIKTWKALAETSLDTLNRILDDAGSNFQLADPGTWPKQAQLAAEGNWEELEAYQDALKGGKEVK